MKSKKRRPSVRGRKYKSRLEAAIAKRLGKHAIYEETTLHYIVQKSYRPDFTVNLTGGKTFLLEVKGFFRYEDQVKMKAVKICNPDLDIRFFFPSDGKVQGSKMRCSEWAEKYGFPYAIGQIPKEWL